MLEAIVEETAPSPSQSFQKAVLGPQPQKHQQYAGGPSVLEPSALPIPLAKHGPTGLKILQVSSTAICSPVRWGNPDLCLEAELDNPSLPSENQAQVAHHLVGKHPLPFL